MSQKDIEVILFRQLASYLATPMLLVDTAGNLIFYNEAAENVVGRRFEETGEMTPFEWTTAFTPTDEKGRPLKLEAIPLAIALFERRPAHRRFSIRGLDNVQRSIETVAFPLVGQADRHLGAAVVFWETGES